MSTLSHFEGKLKGTNYLFPSDDIDPKLKSEPDYCRQYAQAILFSYFNNDCAFSYKNTKRIELLRAYMEGRQPGDIYRDMILGPVDGSAEMANHKKAEEYLNRDPRGPHANEGQPSLSDARTQWNNMDFDTVYSPATKIMNNILGKLEKTSYDISVDAIDEKSDITRTKIKGGIAFDMKFKPQRDDIHKGLGLQPPDEVLPEDNQELDLFISMGGAKLPYEIGMEDALNHSLDVSDNPHVNMKLRKDFIEIGMASVIGRVDMEEQIVYKDYQDPADLILDYCRDDDFSKSRYGAAPKWATLNQIHEWTGMTDDEFVGFARTNAAGIYNNPKWDDSYGENSQGWVFGDWKVPYLYCAWLTTDQEWTLQRDTKAGKRSYNVEFGKLYTGRDTSKRTIITNVPVVYHCYWIPGSDIVWNYGIMNDIAEDEKGCVKLPFHAYKIRGQSIAEQLVSIFDDINVAHLNYLNGKSKTPPPGIAIDLDGLISVNWGSKTVELKDAISLYYQEGVYAYKGSKAGQPPGTTPGKPFEILEGGSALVTKDFLESMNVAMQQIAYITGVDPMTLASEAPKTPVKIAEMGEESVNDSLSLIVTGVKSIEESWCRNAASQIQLICMFNDTDDERGYKAAIGEEGVKAIADAKNRKAAFYGISIHSKSSEAELREFLKSLEIQLTPGKNGTPAMKSSTYSFIYRTAMKSGGLKKAEQYLRYEERKRDQMELQLSQINMSENAKTQDASAQKKIDGKIQLAKIQSELNIKEYVIQDFLTRRKQKELTEADYQHELTMFGLQAGAGAGADAGMQEQQQSVQPQMAGM